MIKRNKVHEKSVNAVRRERAATPWKYFALGILCAVILVGGSFNAAKQHFSSMAYSMDNSELQKTKIKLAAEKRKLEVERDEALSPQNIERAGLKIGLKKYASQDFEYIEPGNNRAGSDQALIIAQNKPKAPAADAKQLVEKTVAQKKTVTKESAETKSTAKSSTVAALNMKENRTLIAKK